MQFWLQQSCLEWKICAYVHYTWSLGDYKNYLGYDAYSIKVFCTIIEKKQEINSFAVCAISQALKKKRLTDEPLKYAETFGD